MSHRKELMKRGGGRDRERQREMEGKKLIDYRAEGGTKPCKILIRVWEIEQSCKG